MRRRLSVAALLLAPLLMAQAAPPAAITDVGSPVLAPVATQFNAEPQTTTGAAVLLSQQANIIGAVRVDAPVAGSIPVGNASIALSVSPGTELFPVLLQQRRNVRTFCTAAIETNVYSPIRPPLITRTCLADTNGDRVFDYLAYMQVNVTPTRSVSGAWEAPPVPHVSGGAITLANTPIPSPVPCERVCQRPARSDTRREHATHRYVQRRANRAAIIECRHADLPDRKRDPNGSAAHVPAWTPLGGRRLLAVAILELLA